MDWDNTHVFEFIELLQSEPAIWDAKQKSHKNRMAVNDAWQRIKDAFSLPSSIDELKKKRNSLMTAYREHLKKKKKDSYTTGSGVDDIYRPTWFAFEALHSFLGPVYQYQDTINTKKPTSYIQRPQSRESDRESGSDSQTYCKKRKQSSQDLLMVKNQMDEAFSLVKEKSIHTKETDENDLFGQMLAQKLKKMNEEDRLMLTHEIHNLVFKYEMKARSRLKEQIGSSQVSTINTSVPSASSVLENQIATPTADNRRHHLKEKRK